MKHTPTHMYVCMYKSWMFVSTFPIYLMFWLLDARQVENAELREIFVKKNRRRKRCNEAKIYRGLC